MQLNKKGLDLITKFEGLRLKAYKDIGGVLTIGYGHTNALPPEIKEDEIITNEIALDILENDLRYTEAEVTKLLSVNITDNQFSALVSFAFNLGIAQLKRSTLLKKLNSGDTLGAANEFRKWDIDGGKVVVGLTRRREAERGLFLSQEA